MPPIEVALPAARCRSSQRRPPRIDRNSRCGGFLYSAFAETFRAFRGINFATRLRWLFELLKPRAIAGGANNLSQLFTWFFQNDQSLEQDKKLNSFARR
jgi:hypothetical protein